MTEWQPIETAPKDGRDVLLWCPASPGYLAASIVAHWYDGLTKYARWEVSNVGGWEWECDLDLPNATHWMPLPDKPAD